MQMSVICYSGPMKPAICERCLTGIGSEAESATLCTFCFQDGRLQYAQDDVHTFRRRYFDKLHAEGASKFVARFHTLLIGHAPYWQQRRY